MNPSHSVKLRSKTLVRLRSIADDLEASVSAVIKHAVEEAIDEALRSASVSIPIRTRTKADAKEAFEKFAQPVRLEGDTEARLRTIVAQTPLLKVSSFIRGAVENFVERAHLEGRITIKFRAAGGSTEIPASNEREA